MASPASSRVSVVIATHRASPWIGEAVESVVSQTYDRWEMLVVLDGSRARAPRLSSLGDRYRRIEIPSSGVSAARNVGVAAARGDLVAFLDDDDRWLPEKLEAQCSLLSRTPGAVMCHTQFCYIDENGERSGAGWAEPVSYGGMLAGAWGVLTSASVFRRSVLAEVGDSRADLRIAGDLDLLFRVARRGPVAFVPDVLTEYRVHSHKISSARFRHYREARSVFRSQRELERSEGHEDRARLASLGLGDLRRHFREGARRQLRREMLRGRIGRAAYHASLFMWLCAPSRDR